MKKRHMMKSAHKIAKEIVFLVGDYMIALKLALKEVWRLVKLTTKSVLLKFQFLLQQHV
ncbi:hypothetical protein [Staphylococcus pseudintermedius]|uniref:hypothetical protein n=1 Tax=Staphylococcus pseudintermedius TaxID=283734 RepID=UPI0015DD756C|nr:hypothetical protein [Staphylococcus pseudintermedius]